MYDTLNFQNNSNDPNHYVYWLGQDGNLWVNQNGNTFNVGAPAGDAWKNGHAEGTKMSMGSWGTLINDPNPGNPGSVPSATRALAANAEAGADYYYTGSGSGGSSTSSADAIAKQNAIKSYNEAISRTNSALDGLDASLQNKLDQINGEYDVYKNEQQSTYNKQKNEYDTSTRQNMGNLASNRNQIMTNASNGLRGLLSVLGARGAGGGSAALYLAPQAVKSQADQENAGAGKTYAQNQQNLDTNWNNYLTDYDNDKKKLEDWREWQIKSAKQDTEKERINLLEQLSQHYLDRSAQGVDAGDNQAQITNRINAANQSIRDLGQYTTPQYTGVSAVYNAPSLSSYDTGNTDLTTQVNENSNGTSSLLTMLQGMNKKKQNPNGWMEA